MSENLQPMLAEAQAKPWRFGFVSLLRRISAARQDLPEVGRAQRPRQEHFRLGQHAALTFAPREIAQVDVRTGQAGKNGVEQPVIRLFGLGMLGPNGALPIHYTETVRERRDSRRDETLTDFLDLFHHRAFTHLYRAWHQAQAAAGLDRAQQEGFTPYVARLAGDEPTDAAYTALPSHARWASAAHRVRPARNPDGLVATLQRFFGVPVVLHEYQLHWIPIKPGDLCLLGRTGQAAMLGQGALLGQAVPDRQNKFRLTMGPLSLAAYLRLTPQGSSAGKDLPSLVEWVRAFIGYEYEWELELLVQPHAAVPARLGGAERLGWSSWMGRSQADARAVAGMVFEPETYIQKKMFKDVCEKAHKKAVP